MGKTRGKPVKRKPAVVRGRGIISSVLNKAIDLLPIELHLPSGIGTRGLKTYNYCGPGTKLKERLARGDKGINGLDEACKLHDIAYSQYKDSDKRRKADEELAERAWQRVKASDSSFGEKAAAWAVTTAMKAKSKLGSGRVNKKKKNPRTCGGGCSKRGKGLYLKPYIVGSGGKGTKKKKGQKKTSKSR